jgi:MoxR-like ATPase
MNLKGVHLFPLPAPQLDRFMIRLSIGFPNPQDEAEIIKQHGRTDGWKNFDSVVDSDTLIAWQKVVDSIEIHPDIIDYIVACVAKTRSHPDVLMGASPRTGVKVSRLVRSLAMIRGEDYVDIDVVKEVFIHAVAHRIVMKDQSISSEQLLADIIADTPLEVRR